MTIKSLPLGLAMVAVVLLAGCTSGGAYIQDTDEGTPPPIVDDDSGSLAGIVATDELLPLAGATVAILDLEAQVLTGEDGTFVINGIPTGSYVVYVQKLGYETHSERVDFVAGQVTEAQFTLVAIPVAEPRVESIPFQGRFECALTFLDIRWMACPASDTLFPESEQNQYFTKDLGSVSIVAELSWAQASAGTGNNLDFNLVSNPREGCQWYANVFGPSPQRIYYTVGEEFVNPDSPAPTGGCEDFVLDDEDVDIGLLIHSSPIYVNDVATYGMTFQQAYSGMFSVFYHMDAPTEFSALPDA